MTVYFIPLVPIGAVREFVRCHNCRNSFETAVLESTSESADHLYLQAPFEDDLLSAIALIIMEDGEVTEEEIKVARKTFASITGQELSRETLGHACGELKEQGLTAASFLATASKRRSIPERVKILQGMFKVSSVEGHITPYRMESLLRSKSLLELSDAEFMSAIEQTS